MPSSYCKTVCLWAFVLSIQQVGSTFLRWRAVCKPISPSISIESSNTLRTPIRQCLRCQLPNSGNSIYIASYCSPRILPQRSTWWFEVKQSCATTPSQPSCARHSQSGEACEEFQRDHTSLMSLAGRSTRTAARHDPIFSSHQKKMLPLPLSSIPDDIYRLAT